MNIIVLLSIILSTNVIAALRKFRKDFIFGVSTSAYQIEGGWNENGKGESIWDHMVHNHPETIQNYSNGDLAANSYHFYRKDIEMLRRLGVDAYHFSLSWPRILPNGRTYYVNRAGIDYYNNLINGLIVHNIKPIVTLYHWDMPQKLQDLGGFANPLIIKWFEAYAIIAFKEFGDRVKHWITIHDPTHICHDGYGSGTKAPRVNDTGFGEYLCAKNLVMAHAKAYRAYVKNFKQEQNGICGISIGVQGFYAMNNTIEDKVAAELTRQGEWALFADPIFSMDGGFPKQLSEEVTRKSLPKLSRMPIFTELERNFVKGSSDFFGVSHFTAYAVSANNRSKYPTPSYLNDINSEWFPPVDSVKSASSWLQLARNSLFVVLVNLMQKYGDLFFYVTGNGWSTVARAGPMDDSRILYMRAALESVLDAIDAGVNVKGYMAWSLMDNFEWTQGYTENFGLFEVNFTDPEKTRSPRKSALVYKNIVKTRWINYKYNPTKLTFGDLKPNVTEVFSTTTITTERPCETNVTGLVNVC